MVKTHLGSAHNFLKEYADAPLMTTRESHSYPTNRPIEYSQKLNLPPKSLCAYEHIAIYSVNSIKGLNMITCL